MKSKRPKPEVPSDSGEARPRRKHMTAEDEALWRAVTATIKPLEMRPRTPLAEVGEAAKETAKPATRKPPTKVVAPRPPAPPAPKPAAKSPPPATFEVKRAKRLRRGALEIEDRLDLHGMRQAEAHRALRSFLLSAHARGLRHVKVITGKGRSNEQDDRPFDLHGTDRPGVLKRLVPGWLSESDLAAVVVSFTGAGKQHGGEGALYVHLRRKRSAKD